MVRRLIPREELSGPKRCSSQAFFHRLHYGIFNVGRTGRLVMNTPPLMCTAKRTPISQTVSGACVVALIRLSQSRDQCAKCGTRALEGQHTICSATCGNDTATFRFR